MQTATLHEFKQIQEKVATSTPRLALSEFSDMKKDARCALGIYSNLNLFSSSCPTHVGMVRPGTGQYELNMYLDSLHIMKRMDYSPSK